MKMTSSDFAELKRVILETVDEHPGMKAEYTKKGLSPMRYRWDIMYLSKVDIPKYYHYLNDDHIDTALRKILGS